MGVDLGAGCGRSEHDRRADAALRLADSGATVRFAVSFAARLRGLLGRAPDDELLVIAPCRAIHTFGMRHPLDVAFVGRDGTIAAVYRNVAPRRRAHCRGAVAVIERFARLTPFFTEGDRLAFMTEPTSGERSAYENLSRL